MRTGTTHLQWCYTHITVFGNTRVLKNRELVGSVVPGSHILLCMCRMSVQIGLTIATTVEFIYREQALGLGLGGVCLAKNSEYKFSNSSEILADLNIVSGICTYELYKRA